MQTAYVFVKMERFVNLLENIMLDNQHVPQRSGCSAYVKMERLWAADYNSLNSNYPCCPYCIYSITTPLASKTGILFSIYVNLIYHFIVRKGSSPRPKTSVLCKIGMLCKLAKK